MTNLRLIAPLFGLIWLISFSAHSAKEPPAKYRKIRKYIDLATQDKLAGVVVYIHDPRYGEWVYTSGFASRETREALREDHTFSMGSVGKLYNAVAVLKLAEEGILSLDDKISKYLPSEIIENLPNATSVTIRQLLAHQSGFVNYDWDAELNNLYLSGNLRLDTLSHINAIRRYVYGRAPLGLPGEYHYSSTNYLLLSMIVDKVVAEGHTVYLRNLIHRYGYTNSFYRQTPPEKNVEYYGDLNQDGEPENLTRQTFETTNWFAGDDGVYAPIAEAAHFLQDLMHGKILSNKTLAEMMTWNDDKSPDYGLGLMADKSFPYKFLLGHSGRGIGTTVDLYYFPNQGITVAIFCNTGIRAAAPAFRKSYNGMRKKIVKKLFLF